VRTEVTIGFYELRVLPFAALRARDASLHRLAIECGDIEFAGISLYNQMSSANVGGEDLAACAALCDTLLETSRRIGDRRTELALLLERGQIACLQGTAADPLRYDPAYVDEAALLAAVEATGNRSDLALYWLGKVRLFVFGGEPERALAEAAKLESLIDALPGSPSEAHGSMLLCAVWSAEARRTTGSAHRAALARLAGHRKRLAPYGKTGPANYGHMVKLAEAFHLAAGPSPIEAMAAFDAAIDMAVERDYLYVAALAAEGAGRLQLQSGSSRAARSYLEEAEAAFVQWGAAGPARRVAALRGVAGSRGTSGSGSQTAATTHTMSGFGSQGDRLDGLAVARAAQAISSEVHLADLIDRLLRLALEIGGATRAALVLARDGTTWLAGEAFVENAEVVLRRADPAAPLVAQMGAGIPARVARYVGQTREAVLVRDRLQDGRWLGEPEPGEPPVSSVLAMPLIQGNTLTGVVVLTHELPAAFSPARRDVVATVAAQAAISIHNATLYEELRASLAAQETLTRSYQRFVPQQFLAALGKRSILDVGPGDHIHREITVLFADVRGFTTLAERLGPSETFRFINRYTAAIAPAIHAHGGFINGFLGDGIMALFPTSADDAVAGSVAMQEAVRRFNLERAGSGEPDVRIGIGLNTGPLVLGTIGVEDRMDSGVSGDAVNLASRIEGMTKMYGAPIVIGESTYQRLQAPERFSMRELDYVVAVGRKQAVRVYEVMDGEDAGLREAKQRAARAFGEARLLLQAGHIDRALAAFSAVAEACPADRAARILAQRCAELRDVGVPANWDGSYRLGSK
jgi:class 3 adenylate cyclase